MSQSFSLLRRKPPMPDRRPNACRWCASHVRGKGQEWCWRAEGRECHLAYEIATKSDIARIFVFRRDKGICGCCGKDASEDVIVGWKKVKEFIDYDQKPLMILGARHCGDMTIVVPDTKQFWDVDHIKPIWEAPQVMTLAQRDEYWGIKNMQTLCTECHKVKTRTEAMRRKDVSKRKIVISV